MAKTFEEMDKSELKAAIAENKLETAVMDLGKHDTKVTANDLRDVLNANVSGEVLAKVVVALKVNKGKTPTDEDKVEFGELRRLVIVTDHNTKTSMEEIEEGRVMLITAGNTLNSDKYTVKLDGQPQYVPNKVIKKLLKIKSRTVLTPDSRTKQVRHITKARFSVTAAVAMTQQELDAKAKEQEATRGLNL